ncbi:MAG: alpha/beta fold hydrolase [Lachnospiraceae bacterium]|nr:alpha/beta fold hydrolase [Lachnospiraceae bacterium]
MTNESYLYDDGIRLHLKLDTPEIDFDEERKTPLMILLHGLTGNMEERHIAALKDTCLSHGFAVLRTDLYGHGKSGGEFHDHNLFNWLSNIMCITDAAKTFKGTDGLYLMGHSQGGYAAILAAGMRPDAYRAVIPLSPAISLEKGAKTGHAVGVCFDPDAVPDELPRPVTSPLSGNYIRALQMLDVEAAARRYRGPVLIVHGEADQTVPVQYAYDIAEQFPNCRLEIIPDDLHCYDRHLDQVLETVGDFLDEMRQSGERQ